MALAFPKFELAWLAWFAPGLILISAFGQPGKKIFAIGYLAGLAQYLVSFYWLLLIPKREATLIWLGVGGFMALYTAAWVWVCCRVVPKPTAPGNSPENLTQLADQLASVPWWQWAFWSFLCAAAWVAMEMGVARILTGFPYSLGVSQFKFLPLIQIASLTGVYGVSFLIVWISVSLMTAMLCAFHRPKLYRLWLGQLVWPLIALAAVFIFGFKRLRNEEPTGRELKIALVQPAIPQFVIWDPSEKTNRFKKLVQLSESALAERPDVLVWPEAALPDFMTRFNSSVHDAVTSLVIPHKIWMIFGANDFQARENSGNPPQIDWFNSSFLIAPSGEPIARYHKRHLVVFGEYMPLGRWFPFLNKFRFIDRGFKAGNDPIPFRLTEPNAKISVLICSEDVFPHLVREYADADTDFLLNLTNDGWFGDSAAQWQHAVDALFRAIENGLPLVRCTNNGLTCWVDSRGRLHEVYFPGTKDIYGAGFKIARVPLLPIGGKRVPTFYHRHGDWFGWSCVLLTLVMLLKLGVEQRSKLRP
ncbi:MAG: apolipoprotein N-acyltransferase [Verrucomicrobiota bacterium]